MTAPSSYAALIFAPLAAALLARAWVGYRLRATNRVVLFMHKGGLGDAFCQTGLMRAINARDAAIRFVVVTRYPELFTGHPAVARVVDLSRAGAARRWLIHAGLRLARLGRAHDFVYKPQAQVPKAWCDAHPDRRPHLVELAAARLRVPADFTDVRGTLVFSEEERRSWGEKHRALGESFALVVPAGKTTYTPNKEWGFDRYAAVVAATPGVRWVRLGLADQPALPGAVDLRGATGVRELAWLISRARFVLCGEGLHNHLAGAVGTPCFVVFSGFHYWEIARYPATRPLLAPAPPPCAPCWLKSACPVPGRPCTGDITPARVVAALREAGFAD